MTDVTYDLNAELVALAKRWPLRVGVFSQVTSRIVDGEIERVVLVRGCEECVDCGQAILPPDEPYRVLHHLVLMHGYRMDGRQWNNANEQIGEAKDAYR